MTTPAVAAPAATTETPAVVTEPIAPVAAPVAAAPSAPVVIGEPEAAAPTVAPAAADAAGAITYEPTGDAGLDVALSFVGKLGIPADHPAMLATSTGDFSLIKAHLATMGDKAAGWEQMVALAEAANDRMTEAADARNNAVSAAVIEVAGSEEQWDAVKQWAAANADPSEKTELNAMFAAGPLQARAAAMLLVDLHRNGQGTVVNPAATTTGASAGAVNVNTNGPLTAREFSDAVNALTKKVGTANIQSHPEYIALGKRLAARA
jgi:hypothetical protein